MRTQPQRRRTGPLVLGLLVAVVAVGGIGHWLYGQLVPMDEGGLAETNSTRTSSTATSSTATTGTATASGRDASADRDRPAREDPATVAASQRDPGRTETILTCTSVDGQVFYTNASRCEDADLDNRVNVLATPSLPSSRPDRCLGAQAGGLVRQTFLPVCQEAFNEALDLEPFLLELENPASSPAAKDYCQHITTGVQAGCMATSDQFCFLHLCQAIREAGGS